MSIDSTLSDTHYQERLKQGSMADMILVDHDKLERFKVGKKPVRRLNYCVNDHLFKPLEKTIDVNFHCGSGARKGYPGGNERNELRAQLDGICKELGLSYVSGVLGLPEYAEAMGRSKVVVNLPRTPINRPHRVFDAMAAGACLLTAPIPYIIEDKLFGNEFKYFDQKVYDDLEPVLWGLFKGSGLWTIYSEKGYNTVMDYHTWSIRAQQLRQILSEELGL
jgi:glycosyltransferase involved in cell wall biosynthesis